MTTLRTPHVTTPLTHDHNTARPLISIEQYLAGATPPAEYPPAYPCVNGRFRSGTVGRLLLHTLPEIASRPCPGAGYLAPNPAKQPFDPTQHMWTIGCPLATKTGDLASKTGQIG